MKEIPLTRGYVTIIDDADFEMISKWKWCTLKTKWNVYAIHSVFRVGKRRHVYMHRLLLSAPDNVYVDHIDRNGLNNTRANIRLCSNAQNLWNSGKKKNNSSGYKGVSWQKRDRRWRAKIVFHGQRIHIGYFTDVIEAARAYDAKAIELYGEFASPNFE